MTEVRSTIVRVDRRTLDEVSQSTIVLTRTGA
jgi:hypothetical protein